MNVQDGKTIMYIGLLKRLLSVSSASAALMSLMALEFQSYIPV